MSTRVVSLLWSVALFLAAVLTGGWVAAHLNALEVNALHTWAHTLEEIGQENTTKTARWLEGQVGLLADLANSTPELTPYLYTVQATPLKAAPSDLLQEAFEEKAALKYGFNHTYIFSTQGQLLLQQKSAMTLPLKVREALAFAYQTGLDHYMFFTVFSGKEWFVASKRIRDGRTNLGYVAYLTEANLMLEDVYGLWGQPTTGVDLNLARRVDDADVFFARWQYGRPQLKRFSIQQSGLPLFGGLADIVQVIGLENGEERLFYIGNVALFPFWQFLSSIPKEKAFADVRKARFYYLLGYGVFLLVLLAFLVGLLRRIIRPDAPSWSEIITQHKALAPIKEKVDYAMATVKEKIPMPDWGHAHKALRAFKKQAMARMPWKARELTELEKAQLREKAPAHPVKTSWQDAAPPITVPEPEPEPEPEGAESPTERTPPPAPIRPVDAKKTTSPKHEEAEEEMPDFSKPAPKMVDADAEEIKKVKQIHRCIENEKYRLYFQPILETRTRNKVMFETLLRLVDDHGELMQPPSFFPLAMKHEFVDQLDDMVIVASLRRHMEILTQGKDTILSINLSYGAFRSMNFMQTYKDGLKTGRLKPHLLNFELSSKEIIEDDAAMGFVREMQKSGAKFSVDFFGDPQKTVQAAKKLKFDFMKVDCLKFPGLGEGDAEQVARFRDVIAAGHSQSLPMIAEKIESRNIMWLCEKLNVAYAQGFYLAEPSPKLNLGW